MAIKINGDNSVATPGFTGDDTDTGLQVGTNELNLVTGGTARVTVDSAGDAAFTGKVESGPYSTSSGARLRSSGAVQVRRDAAGERVFEVYKGGTGSGNINASIDSDGGAYFDGDVGIGTDSPSQILELKTGEPRICLNGTTDNSDKGIEFEHNGTRRAHLFHNNSNGELTLSSGEGGSGYSIRFDTDGSERMQIDSSGRVGINVTSFSDAREALRIKAPSGDDTFLTIESPNNTGTSAIFFGDDDFNEGRITYDHNGNNMYFHTNDTERMRLNSLGFLKVGVGGFNNLNSKEHEFRSETDNIVIWGQSTSSTYNVNGIYGGVIFARTTRDSNSAFALFNGKAGNDTEFNLRGDGNGYCDGSWSGGGADYAEYFEWSDGNSSAEDRRGISVVLDGDKIRQAVDGEEPIGVISGNPSVIGDNDIYRWKNKYLRDDFGTYIQEDYEVEDEEGNTVTQQRRKLNPDYNEDQEYVSREDRPEWDCVGLMGKIRIRKGQVTGSRWIKMRDISDSVEEWLVR